MDLLRRVMKRFFRDGQSNFLSSPHSIDSDDAMLSEDSMPRRIDFSEYVPRRKRMARVRTGRHMMFRHGPSFSEDNDDESLMHQLEVCKRCERSCGVCLGNVHPAVKHCKMCEVSYCETHVADHYRAQAFSSHQLVDYKQTSRVSPSRDGSLQRRSSGGRAGGLLAFCSSVFRRSIGISWMLLIILCILTALTFHHCYKDPVVIRELRVMMLGKTGAGKSASGNTILGREAFKSEASPLPVTKSCDNQSGVVEGQNITVIDTPAITTRKAAWLSEKVDPGPHVFLLVIPLRRFTEEDGNEVKWIQRNFGEEALKFTIVLFTGKDQMDHKNAEQFLNESSRLQTLVSSSAGGYHIFDNKTPRGNGQVKDLLEKIEVLLRKNMGYSYSYGLHEQVKTAVRGEEERERREDTGESRRLKIERYKQINQMIKNMEKRIERKIREQMKLKLISRIANATPTLNQFWEVVNVTTEQSGTCKQEQVTTAVEEEEERKRLEIEGYTQVNQVMKNREKKIKQKIREQMKLKMRIANATATLNELRKVLMEEQRGTFGTILIYLAGVVSGLIGLFSFSFILHKLGKL